MADQRPGSYAREIDPDGGIKGPDLTAAFDKARDPAQPSNEPSAPPIHSQQVANTNLSPREPAPSAAYDRAKAAQHVAAMRDDDRAVKNNPALLAKAQLFAQQNAARKGKGAPSLGKSFGKERERGDD